MANRESLVRRWARRTCSVFLFSAGAALLWVFAPLLLPACVLRDVVFRARLAWTRAYLFFLVFLTLETLGILAAWSLWLGYRLHPSVGRAHYLEQNFRLQCWWGAALANSGLALYSIRLALESDYVFGARPILLLVRHASALDTLIAVRFISAEYGVLLKYVLKRELLWDPCLDIVGQRLPNYFLDRGSPELAREVEGVRALAAGLGPREGVLIYPEGTRYTPEKRAALMQRARDKGDEAAAQRIESFRRVLPPRPAGTLALLEANPDLDVVVCEHAGLEASGTLRDLFRGGLIGAEVRVRMRSVDTPDLPADRAAWLDAVWHEVDTFVGGPVA